MRCFSEDCAFVKQHGDCFYDGVPPSNSPKTCEACVLFKAKTHYDRIRAMTDEELSEFLGKTKAFGYNHADLSEYFTAEFAEWLKKEVTTNSTT